MSAYVFSDGDLINAERLNSISEAANDAAEAAEAAEAAAESAETIAKTIKSSTEMVWSVDEKDGGFNLYA